MSNVPIRDDLMFQNYQSHTRINYFDCRFQNSSCPDVNSFINFHKSLFNTQVFTKLSKYSRVGSLYVPRPIFSCLPHYIQDLYVKYSFCVAQNRNPQLCFHLLDFGFPNHNILFVNTSNTEQSFHS
jgi:hypothetical protein